MVTAIASVPAGSGDARTRGAILAHGLLVAALAVLWIVSLVVSLSTLGAHTPGFGLYNTGPYVDQLLVPGHHGKIQPFDRLESVNGTPIARREDLTRLLARLPVGSPVHLAVRLTDQATESIVLPVQRFGWGQWALTCMLPFLVISLGHLLVGAFGFFSAPRSAAARVHLRFTGAMAAWMALIAAGGTGQGLPESWQLLPMPFIGAAGLELALIFPTPSEIARRYPWLAAVPYGIGLILLAVVLASFTRIGRTVLGDPTLFAFVPWATMTFLWALVGLLALLGLTFWKMRKSTSAVVKAQSRLALAGAALAYLPYGVYALGWDAPALLSGGSSNAIFDATLQALFVVFPVAVAYAIARHRLFDIEVVIKKSLVYATVTGLLAGGFSILSGASRLFIEPVIGHSQIPNVVATAAVVLLFAPLRDRVQKLVDRAFHRVTYDFRGVVLEFTERVREIVDPQAAIALFETLVTGALKPAYVMVLAPQAQSVPAGATLVRLEQREVEAIALGPKLSDDPYLPEDQALVQHLGQNLAMALENAKLFDEVAEKKKLEHELEIARKVQMGLLPKKLPVRPDVEIAALCTPAGQVGGDLYDVVELGGGRLGILIGDVSGKGVPAALLMSGALSVFRTAAPTCSSPAQVLGLVNEHVCQHGPGQGNFVAACYAILDGSRITVTNAGMPKPLHNGAPINATGLPAGFVATYAYKEVTLDLAPGDTVAFLTDGWEDAKSPSGEAFGDERILELARRRFEASARDLVGTFRAESDAFMAGTEPFDDRTVVAIRCKPAATEATGNPRDRLEEPASDQTC